MSCDARRRATPGRRRGDDIGTTLIEMMVTLTVISVVLMLFTSAVVRMYATAHHAESLDIAQSQLQVALQRLDTEVRYASDLTEARELHGAWYVELLTEVTGTRTCVQLRLSDAALQRRTWTEGEFNRTRSDWLPLASGVRSVATTSTDAAPPFQVLAADAGVGFERLRLRVAVTAGAHAAATSSESDITFTALNTVRNNEESTCTEERPAP